MAHSQATRGELAAHTVARTYRDALLSGTQARRAPRPCPHEEASSPWPLAGGGCLSRRRVAAPRLGREASENSLSRAVTRKAACSAMSTALSPDSFQASCDQYVAQRQFALVSGVLERERRLEDRAVELVDRVVVAVDLVGLIEVAGRERRSEAANREAWTSTPACLLSPGGRARAGRCRLAAR